ncbi:MAG TPA: nickel insertion protein, partial [Peptostreptococcaceae bacterium]|nr:nickel insertion protein [Peptostreptococcaceae bacterium]
MEERILYLDMVNGISGDMTLAALIDLGIPEEIFLEELSKLNLSNEYEIKVTSKEVNGIVGKNVE